MAPFSDYIRSLRDGLENLSDSSKVCLIAGNETCDVDSIVSAVVYAHYISTTGSFVTDSTVPLPLVQCRRAELAARTDAALVLEELGVEEAWLIFLDDVTPELLSKVGQLSIILVDHNEPTGILSPFGSQVIRVVDHREKASSSPVNREGVTSVLELVGSCSTLVARELLNNDSYEMEECVARALASVILSDTGKLLAKGRVTDTDVSTLKGLSNFLPPSFDNDKQYSKYMSAKFDISNLSVREVLERDFKDENYGDRCVRFCTVTSRLSEYLIQPGAKEAIADFYRGHNLSALVMFGVSIKDLDTAELERQIAVYQPEGDNHDFAASLTVMLESSREIRCERLEGLEEFEGVVMQQGNNMLSRKQIIPIMAKFMRSIDIVSPTAISPEFPAEGLSPPLSPQSSDDPYPLEPKVNIVSKAAVSMATVGEATATGVAEGEGEASASSEDKDEEATKSKGPDLIPEYTAAEECKDRTYHFVSVGGDETIISMAMVEPYKKLVQHAGYVGESRMALLVVSAAHLPPRSLPNYQHVLHHTFYYVLSMVDKLIVDNYMIVYFHSGAPKRSMPSIPILHKFYKMIDRRLKKQLMKLYIVHPTFLVKCMIKLARPVLSKKFWRKVHFVPTLQDLSSHVDLDKDFIPEAVYARDLQIMATMPKESLKKQDSRKDEHDTPPEKEETPPEKEETPPEKEEQEAEKEEA